MERRWALLAMIAAAVSARAADEPQPVGRWVFAPENVKSNVVVNLAGGVCARLQHQVPFADAGSTKALHFDGGANAVAAGDANDPAGRLVKQFTAEAWVRVDEHRRWSRFVGVVARQQDKRKGWLIGTHYDRHVFSLGTIQKKGEMTDLHSAGGAHPGQWCHVAGTYDGTTMRLFVNGLLAGESTEQSGEALLPTDTPLSMADYHDGAEFYPLKGLLHEVRVYGQALPAETLRAHYLSGNKALGAAPPMIMSGCFGDSMVLQREVLVPVWGQTLPGEEVTVLCAGARATAKADGKGFWRLSLPAMPAGGPFEFVVETPQGRIVYRDVLIGDVWYCAGQSNLAYGTKASPERGLAAQPNPQIRFFTVVRESADKPLPFTGGAWEPCHWGTAKEFSAVGFFFGNRLHAELKVPIGLFNASWGGTPVESWISHEALATLPEMQAALKEKPADLWERSGLFNQMTHPLIPYALRGVVWYQGENNIGNSHQYEQRFGLLIRDWRKRWGLGDFPFYYVQPAPFRYGGAWDYNTAELWDAQRRVLALPNTGMVGTSDATSNLGDNHASNKFRIGERLALWALAKTYGRGDVVCSGPLYRGMSIEGGRVRIAFDYAAGLKARDGKPLDWFTVAGADRRFTNAVAAIEGEAVVVSSPDVPEPAAVRFAWGSTAQPNLVNGAGLPALPFRTDDWPAPAHE